MSGSVSLAPLVLREFERGSGFTLPKTRDPKALSQLSATTNFAYGSKALTLTQLATAPGRHADSRQSHMLAAARRSISILAPIGSIWIAIAPRQVRPTAESTSSPQPAQAREALGCRAAR